jgi:two-component system osmolarity sensor histidine kinase EnvZ
MRLPALSLFWRTFLLILLFLAIALIAWWQSFRVVEREPRAQVIANQVVSIVNVTRSALLYSDPLVRRELLSDLADNEGIRIAPKEPNDQITPLPDLPLIRLVTAKVTDRLGPTTQIAAEVNGLSGIWVSFAIEGDAYWVVIDRDPLTRELGRQWIGWAAFALLLSLIVAAIIARTVNQPLAHVARAARALGAGRTPQVLPESGPSEIQTVNQSFNRMVASLAQTERDRAVLLAGISHDLRTPLTRLRLELEVNALPEETRAAMVSDIEQMDAIVRQFLDYARSTPQTPAERVDLSALATAAVARARLDTMADVELRANIAPNVTVNGYAVELSRALDNLLTNALRYGRSADGRLMLDIECVRTGAEALLCVADHGAGIAPEALERVLRPFERGDAARSGTTGAGLGLAIVDRIARQHGGSLALVTHAPRGLLVQMRLPATPPATD